MSIREGRWDCPTCGAAAHRGGEVRCPGCGDPRPEGVRFYLPDEAEVLAEAERLARARAGADWICGHCSASVPATAGRCPGCGAERDGSVEQRTVEYAMADVPRTGERSEPPADPPPPARGGGRRRPRVVLAFLALVAGLVWWNAPRAVDATVAEKAWERSIEVQRLRTVREEDWELPAGARQLAASRAVREHRQVVERYETRTREVSERVQVGTRTYVCGQRDLGNGFFQDVTCTEPEYETRVRSESYQEPVHRSEPVYGTRYAYEIERWVTEDTVRAAGDAAAEPVWPGVRSAADVRAGPRAERYTLAFTGSRERRWERESDAAEYARYRPGDTVRLRVGRRGGRVEIVPP
jgi:hypothetical protein